MLAVRTSPGLDACRLHLLNSAIHSGPLPTLSLAAKTTVQSCLSQKQAEAIFDSDKESYVDGFSAD